MVSSEEGYGGMIATGEDGAFGIEGEDRFAKIIHTDDQEAKDAQHSDTDRL